MKKNVIIDIVSGMNEARSLYKEQAYMPPFCLQFHLQMINIEGAQEKPNTARIRKLFESACDQFGKTDAGKAQINTMDLRAFKNLYQKKWGKYGAGDSS